MSFVIDKDAISETNIDELVQYIEWNPQYKGYFIEKAGKEHYRLLANLSLQLVKMNPIPLICDIGTLYGSSALALSIAETAQVITYDINNVIPANNKTIGNISNIKRKLFSAQLDIDTIVKADLVVLDIDPHCGNEETKFLALLRERGFKGVLVLDDIFLNDGMRKFWEGIPEKKWDITHVGHSTGTGIVVFPGSKYSVVVN